MQLLDSTIDLIHIFGKYGFRDFHAQKPRVDIISLHEPVKALGNVDNLKILTRYVDGDWHDTAPFHLPFTQDAACAFPDKPVQPGHQTALFHQRHKLGRRNASELGMFPARQSFHRDDFSGYAVVFGLQKEGEAFILKCLFHVRDQTLSALDGAHHRMVKPPDALSFLTAHGIGGNLCIVAEHGGVRFARFNLADAD